MGTSLYFGIICCITVIPAEVPEILSIRRNERLRAGITILERNTFGIIINRNYQKYKLLPVLLPDDNKKLVAYKDESH
jgi:hypothetical protein